MLHRASAALFFVGFAAACAGAGPSALRYAGAPAPAVTYLVGDTLALELRGLGEEMEIGARSRATYVVRFAGSTGGEGSTVSATVESLSADIVTPMTEPMALDEGAIDGDFLFELDVRGRAASMSSPVASGGGQAFAAPIVAHALFPRLSGEVGTVGDSWVDSVAYREGTDAGETSIESTLTYTILGESRDGPRTLLEIGFEGTAAVSQALSIQGAGITQESEMQVSGRLRWDATAGLLHESEMIMEGPGTVRVALLPAALPTRVRWLTRVRMQED